MRGSEHGFQCDGVGKFWVACGANPETYSYGSCDSLADAEAEADHLMAEGWASSVTVGEGVEIDLTVPDADDIIDRMACSVYDQCGEVSDDFLYRVPEETKDELTAEVEKAVAGWMTRHNLWPTFCAIEEVKVVRAGPAHAEG